MYKMIGVDGAEYGPVTAEQVREWIAAGRANAHSKLQVEGSTEWKPLGSFPEFAAVAPLPPPAVPPIYSSAPPQIGGTSGRPLTRTKAWTCALINQLAFPGLGTIMARRPGGYLQATLMLIGFVMTVGFMFAYMQVVFRLLLHPEIGIAPFREFVHSHIWTIVIGLFLCMIAWCWSLATSIAILRAVHPPSPG